MRLKPWDERERTQQEIANRSRRACSAVPGVVAFPSNPPSLGQSQMRQADQVRDPDLAAPTPSCSRWSTRCSTRRATIPGWSTSTPTSSSTRRSSIFRVDREKAAATGVEIDTVGRTLETMLGGRQVTRFKRNGEQYDVIVQIADIDRHNPDDMRRIYVRGRDNAMVQLSNLVSIKETVAPKELNHFNQLRAATITAHARARLHAERRPGLPQPGGQGRAAGDGAYRLFGPVARIPGSQRQHVSDLPAGALLHLSRAGGAVRELHRSVHHHADRAAVDDRRAARAVAGAAARSTSTARSASSRWSA